MIENINLITYALHIGFILYVVIVKRKDFWYAITGGDGSFDPLDLLKLVWIFCFVSITFGDLFLNLEVGDVVWYSLDGILFGVILKDFSKDYLKFKGDDSKTKNKE